jgi:ATP:ADP antiporter, AAA family
MGSNAIFSKVFNLKKGEGKTVFLLTAYSFFAGLAYAYFYATSTTLFLAKFDIKMLPYAYIGQGVVSYIVWLSYKRFAKWIIPSRLFMLSGLFLLISVVILAGGYIFTQGKFFAFFLFVWYNIFLLLNGISFWGIATKIFDIRQAKRLFGLISSGETFARIISFFSVSVLAKLIKTDEIYYFSIAGLIVCIILAPIITNTLKEKIDIKHAAAPEPVKEQPTSSKGIGKLMENKYFGYIFLLALFPLFATFYIDFMFLGQVKIQYTNAKVISEFLSLFLGSMSVAEFLLRTFVSGRLISKYGVLFGILMLPITLAMSTTFAAVYGSFYGAIGLFFSFIILSRLFIRVVRTIFFDSTFQIFYQPIPIHDRLALQSKVEGVSKSIGFILAGAILVVLAHTPFLDIVHYNYIFLAVIGVWIWLSFKLYHEYRGSLKAVLANLISQKNIAKISAFASLSSFVTPKEIKKTQITLNLTERTYPHVADLLMLRLLPKVEPDTQNAILERINYKKVTPAVNVIDFCINHHNSAAVPFKEVKKELQDNANLNFKTLSALANSADAEERLKAVYLMDNHENYNNYKLLMHLLQDEDIRVRNMALIICGKMKKHELWPHIIESLYNPRSAYAAAIAVRQVGEPILNDLVEFFNKDNLPKAAQIKIIDLFAEVNSKQITRLLKSKIILADDDVRRHIFTTLGEMQFQFPQTEFPLIKNYIEQDIDTIAWIVAAMLDMGEGEHHDNTMLHHSLQLEFAQKKAFVFLELSMIYDRQTINFFIHGFEDASQESRAYALEVLDMTVSQEFKPLFLPLLTDLEHHEMLKAYDVQFTQERFEVKERLEDIINKNYSKINPWTKACAVNLIAHYDDVEDIMLANVLNDSKVLSEMALWKLYNKYPQKLDEFVERIADKDKPKVTDRLWHFGTINKTHLLIFDAVAKLKHNSFFKELTEFDLVPVAEEAKQHFLTAGERLVINKAEQEDLFFVLEGACRVQTSNDTENLAAGEFYWYVQSGPSISELAFTAKTDTILLQIDSNTMFTLLAEHMHLSKRIINVLSKQEA